MLYKILADNVVLIHFLWIVFLFLGAVWGKRRKAVKIIHITGLIFAFFLVIFNWYCPLTYLEVWLRSRHDPSLTYKGSFIIYYAEKLIYVELPRYLIAISTIFLCGFNGWLYIKRGKEISLKSIFASLTFLLSCAT